jgi:hypothetical protein
MNDTTILPAPDISAVPVPKSKWAKEYETFRQLLPSLLTTHRGEYVAIHNGQVVASGDDQVEVALRAYDKVGYVPLHVGLVTTEPPPVIRFPSPRVVRSKNDSTL